MPEILKEQVAAVTEEVEHLGMCRHKSGNLSIFDPETGYAVIMPNSVVRGVLGAECIYIMDLWGKVIERVAGVKPFSETVIHLYVYKERKDTRAVVHTYARYSTAFPIINKFIIPIIYECAYLGKMGMVPVALYGRAGAVDLTRKVVEVMKEYDCCLIKSHGVIAADKDMDAALLGTQYVEETAEAYYITLAAGNGIESHALSMRELQKWAYLKEIILWEDRKTKKIINTPEYYTDDMLCGIYVAHPDMMKYVENDLRCYCTAKKKQGRVAIIIGGGVGYLPLFLGYAGGNLLDGCGVDDVSQLPSLEQTYNVAKEAEADTGVLFLYGDYTGDIMNFDMAAEIPDMDDIRTANIVGADNVLSNKDAQTRHRVVGIFFMRKCTGARTAQMEALEGVPVTAGKVRESTRTAGLTPMSCIIPGIGHSSSTLAEDEIVFGMGIHGESGVWNGLVRAADELAEESMGEVLADTPLDPSEEVCALINGLGAISQEELYILSESVYHLLGEKGIRVHRALVGEYATSTEMVGAFMSICRMTGQKMKQWVNIPVHMPFYTQA